MSVLNASLLLGAVVLTAVYLANAFAYRKRFGTWLRPQARSEARTANVSAGQISSAVIVVVAGVAYVGAPIVLPESGFAQWLHEPYALPIYIVWCVLLAAVVGSVFAVAAHWGRYR